MQIQINTNNSVDIPERPQHYYTAEIESEFSRFAGKITRVEVHFGDENGEKSDSRDKRCLIEVRMENMNPIVTTEHSETLEKAFRGAVDKMKVLAGRTLEKQRPH